MTRQLYAIIVAGCVAGLATAQAQTTLTHGHADVGVAFEGGAWDLHVHDGESDTEFEPEAVVLVVPGAGLQKVPEDARYGFLGAAGSPVWVLPETENHDLLFLGLAAEEIEAGVFAEEQIVVRLKGVEGPGDFILYHTDAFGAPVVTMNSEDGIDEADVRVLAVGRHSHVNWVFTQPGTYRIGLQAAGVLVSDGLESVSEVAEFVFEVEPARLRSGHADVGVAFEGGTWDLHVHDGESDTEFEPGSVVLVVPGAGVQKVPEDARYGFLGAAGSPVWVLPETENHDLLFLGLAAEEIEAGVFAEEQITVSLKGVEGPGDFILYHTDAFGSPVVAMNSADGIDEADVRVLAVGSHNHVNWVFTQPGTYRIGLQAAGVLVSEGLESVSEVAEFVFEVEFLPMLRVREGHGELLILEWLSREHHEYQLESAVDPAQGSWAAHPGVDRLVGDGSMMSVTVDIGGNNVFFRLAIHEDEGHRDHHEHD